MGKSMKQDQLLKIGSWYKSSTPPRLFPGAGTELYAMKVLEDRMSSWWKSFNRSRIFRASLIHVYKTGDPGSEVRFYKPDTDAQRFEWFEMREMIEVKDAKQISAFELQLVGFNAKQKEKEEERKRLAAETQKEIDAALLRVQK